MVLSDDLKCGLFRKFNFVSIKHFSTKCRTLDNFACFINVFLYFDKHTLVKL